MRERFKHILKQNFFVSLLLTLSFGLAEAQSTYTINSGFSGDDDLLKETNHSGSGRFAKRDIYYNDDFLSIPEIKNQIVSDFVSSLSLNFEMVSKQELKDVILKLLNNLIEKNSDHLFEPSFFPSEQLSYVNWVRKSLLLLGWKIRKGEDSLNAIFSNLFEKNGMIVGVIAFSETTKANIDQKQHQHYIEVGYIDFSVIVTPDFIEIRNEQMPSRIVNINHNDLPKLHLKLKKLLALK